MKNHQTLQEKIISDNQKIFAMLSNYLNRAPDLIEREEIEAIAQNGVSREYAFAVILAAAFGMDIVDNPEDKDFFHQYFIPMIRQLDPAEYRNNPYYQNISFTAAKAGGSELKYEKYKAYEGFVWNDIVRMENGRQIPQIGFFDEEFTFPAVLEKGRIWMTITPNEIETMKEAVSGSFGRVLTFGLGLGYFAYMAAEKPEVESVTVVDMNQDVIDLFKENILPQFRNAHKINIIKADAFEYAKKHLAKERYDVVFTDLWHDVSDGMDMYLKMKKYEKESPATKYFYWIEKSILCYLPNA